MLRDLFRVDGPSPVVFEQLRVCDGDNLLFVLPESASDSDIEALRVFLDGTKGVRYLIVQTGPVTVVRM